MQNEVTALELVKNFFFSFHGLELEYQLCRGCGGEEGSAQPGARICLEVWGRDSAVPRTKLARML